MLSLVHEGVATQVISRSSARRNYRPSSRHNLPPIGRVVPQQRYRTIDVAKGQADVLQEVFGPLKSPAKTMALETGLSERACRNQLAGINSMNLADFFNACQAIPELREWGAKMMGLSGERRAQEISDGIREITLRIDTNGVRLGGAD